MIIKLYEEFNNHTEIDKICNRYGIRNYTINSDGSVDVDNRVILVGMNFKKLPIKFNKVFGDFIIEYNNLITLEGCPKEVDGGFNCGNNQLISLVGGPIKVGGYYQCHNNEDLDSFNGVPDGLSDIFNCKHSKVYNLWKLFQDTSKIELFNDLDIVREDHVIILDRLNDFLDVCDEKPVTEVKGYKCI